MNIETDYSNTKRLILSSIPADFDPKSDILLGPWCLLDKEHLFSEWEKINIAVDPLPTTESLVEASNLTCEYASSLIPILTEKLNQINEVNYSIKFWRLMLLPWLILLVQSTWERQCRIKRCIKEYHDHEIEVPVLEDTIIFDFDSTLDYLHNGVLNPIYNYWILSRVLEKERPDKWKLLYEKTTGERNSINIENKISLIKKVYDILLGGSRCKGVFGISRLSRNFWSMFLSLKPIREKSEICKSGYDKDKDGLEWNIDFEPLVWNLMPKCFKDVNNISRRKFKAKKGKFRLIGPLIYWNEIEKYRLGLCIENGEEIVLAQHGSGYGTAKVYPFPSQIEYSQHAFFSWGWREQEDYKGNIIALSSPYLSKFHNKYKPKNNSLILVCAGSRVYRFRLDSFPQPFEIISYLRNRFDFLKNISPIIFNKLYYRPSPDNHPSLSEKYYLERDFPKIKICEGKLHPQILKCKMLVIDNPGTTLNIAMAANIPVIFFWNKQHWAMCRQAVPCFEALEKVGIMYQNGRDAAEKVNEVWDNVQSWWNQKVIQDARKDWCYQYARTSKLWWWEWAKALWKM